MHALWTSGTVQIAPAARRRISRRARHRAAALVARYSQAARSPSSCPSSLPPFVRRPDAHPARGSENRTATRSCFAPPVPLSPGCADAVAASPGAGASIRRFAPICQRSCESPNEPVPRWRQAPGIYRFPRRLFHTHGPREQLRCEGERRLSVRPNQHTGKVLSRVRGHPGIGHRGNRGIMRSVKGARYKTRMAVFLVLCDPEDAESARHPLAEYGDTFRLSRSNYLLRTDRHRDDVWSDLRRRPEIRVPDALLVVAIQDPFRTLVSGDARRWLERVWLKDNNEPFL